MNNKCNAQLFIAALTQRNDFIITKMLREDAFARCEVDVLGALIDFEQQLKSGGCGNGRGYFAFRTIDKNHKVLSTTAIFNDGSGFEFSIDGIKILSNEQIQTFLAPDTDDQTLFLFGPWGSNVLINSQDCAKYIKKTLDGQRGDLMWAFSKLFLVKSMEWIKEHQIKEHHNGQENSLLTQKKVNQQDLTAITMPNATHTTPIVINLNPKIKL